MSIAKFEFHWEVQPSEIDDLQHVNNLVYLRWALKAAVAHSSALGWTPERYRELGFGWVVRSHQIKYRRPALLGDQIVVRTWIADMEKVSSTRRYQILRAADEATLAEAETQWAFVDLQTLQLSRVPDEIRAVFGVDSTEGRSIPS